MHNLQKPIVGTLMQGWTQNLCLAAGLRGMIMARYSRNSWNNWSHLRIIESVGGLKLMNFRQRQDENLDCFINRCKLLALKCEFEGNELNERLIELIIASTPIPDYQKELLGKNKTFTLDEIIQLGRANTPVTPEGRYHCGACTA